MLGRKAEAVRLARRALSEGSDVLSLNCYSEFLHLSGYEPFETLIRPAG